MDLRMSLAQYNALDIEHFLASTEAAPSFPPASDREAWKNLQKSLGKELVSRIHIAAEDAAATPIPTLPATLYLDCKRTGVRETYQDPEFKRRRMLGVMTLAECLEKKGRYLDPILNVTWAICEESSWALPAHQFDLADMENPVVDLGAAMTALNMAEVDHLLGADLDPGLGKRIRYEVNRRCFVPYLSRHDFWWLYKTQMRDVNNWTAVCNSGIVGAAIYLEKNNARLAEMIAKAARSLVDYLNTFDVDGGSSEGPGYWSYGFGYFIILAHLVSTRTAGKVNFLEGEHIRKIAQFPLNTQLSRGMFVNFSDCDRFLTFPSFLPAYLGKQLDLPGLLWLSENQKIEPEADLLTYSLRDLMWRSNRNEPTDYQPAQRNWYSGMSWMIARYQPADADALVLAAKGGDNGEMHNQNDVGNFIVHFKQESLIADIGRGRYTRQYFGPERYDFLVNSSLGHSVPAPNSTLQMVGSQYAANLLEYKTSDEEDFLHLELKDAYPKEARLKSLARKINLHREAPLGWVEITDQFEFEGKSGPFETALTTLSQVEIGDDGVVIKGSRGSIRIGFNPEVVNVRMDLFHDVELSEGADDVRRIVFSLVKHAKKGAVHLEIVPL